MSNRSVLSAFFLLALTGLIACWCDTALLWDGAYQLCCTLSSGRPFIYLSRFHSWIVWWPVVWLAPHTGNLRLLKMAFGLPFCLAPLAGAALSWWIVRHPAPHLMLWALLGVALAPLPGQIFMINDSIFQLHLFWPVFLAALLPITPAQRATMVLLSFFQLSHPMGIGLCAFAAAVALLNRRIGWAIWLAVLSAAGAWKLLRWPDPYAAREATFEQVRNTFAGGMRGLPMAGVLTLWLAAAALVFIGFRPGARLARSLGWAALGLLGLGGAGWILWANSSALWVGALGYRRWAALAALPLFLAAVWEKWRGEPISLRYRSEAGVLAASIFFFVLLSQSLYVSTLLGRLDRETAAAPSGWLPAANLPWVRGTVLDHWGLASEIILTQGQTPQRLLWDDVAAEASREKPPQIVLTPFNFLSPAGDPKCWFSWGNLPAPPPEPRPAESAGSSVSF